MLVPRSPPRPASRLGGAELVTSQRRTRAELQAEFGDRPAGLDRDVARSLLLGFAIFGLVVLLVVGLVVLLIVWLVRRGQSRPAPGPAGWGPPPPGQGP